MPAISNVMVEGGRQATQFVQVSGTLPVWTRKLTRIRLPDAHEGALNSATNGLAVLTITGILPVTNGSTVKSAVFEAVSPEEKSLTTTRIR